MGWSKYLHYLSCVYEVRKGRYLHVVLFVCKYMYFVEMLPSIHGHACRSEIYQYLGTTREQLEVVGAIQSKREVGTKKREVGWDGSGKAPHSRSRCVGSASAPQPIRD